MPANTYTQTTWLWLWPTRTRNRNCVKVTVVGVTYEITSSALIWRAWEGSIRWVKLGEHHVMICRSSSSGTYDTCLTVSAVVTLCECWMWCWLQHMWASVACAVMWSLGSCTCFCNIECSWHISSLSSNVSYCLGRHNVLFTSDDISTVHLCFSVTSCTDFLMMCSLIWRSTAWMERSTLKQCYFFCLGHGNMCVNL